jgi:hypothetical protein
MLQRVSYFPKEIQKQSETQNEILEQAFSSAYFLIKAFIANRQFVPLLNHIEQVYHVDSLKYFEHRSRGAQHEIFLTLGQTMKSNLLSKVRAASVFGLLTNEVSDVSVAENLVTFIQFFCEDTGSVETHFLACQNILTFFTCKIHVQIVTSHQNTSTMLKHYYDNCGNTLKIRQKEWLPS